jgi:enamine deaminase RidA (YjgF/YER057c/UK114 family)
MRTTFPSGGQYEDYYGYSRAVRVGNQISVSGSTARSPHSESTDAYVQAVSALGVIRAALEEAGSSMANVTRTVTYITSIDYVDAVARAHKEAFDDIRPAATCVVVTSLVAPNLLVEIQADAVVEGWFQGGVAVIA